MCKYELVIESEYRFITTRCVKHYFCVSDKLFRISLGGGFLKVGGNIVFVSIIIIGGKQQSSQHIVFLYFPIIIIMHPPLLPLQFIAALILEIWLIGTVSWSQTNFHVTPRALMGASPYITFKSYCMSEKNWVPLDSLDQDDLNPLYGGNFRGQMFCYIHVLYKSLQIIHRVIKKI